MKLLTKKIEKTIPALYSQENVSDPMCRVKFFNPAGMGTWYVIERDEDTCFGYVDMGEPELGYFSISELESIQLPFGLKIERDLWWDPKPLSEVMKEV